MSVHSQRVRSWLPACLTLIAWEWLMVNAAPAATAKERPNVVIILADDLGYGDLSSYGATDMQTPSIDGLVEAGMRFDRFYANCPVCSPTRASLMTGRYPDLVGVPGVIRTHATNSWGYLSPEAITLPQMMRRAGYHTALVGKWHLGLSPANAPTARGFDLFKGFLGDMMDDYYTHRRHGINYMRHNTDEIDPEGHATDLFSQWAVDYIRERSQSEAPFFLYLAYNAPHTPIQPPEKWLRRVREREPGIDEKRARLVALIEHMDHGIGQVVAALKETGEWENTLLIFNSDNGGQVNVGASNGSLRSAKGDMYEGGIRVPMCAVWPGHIAAGSRSGLVCMTMDIYPTACQAAGVQIDHFIDGRSLLPHMAGQSAGPGDRDLFWVRREGGDHFMGLTSWAMRRGEWKLVQNSPGEAFQLFNLQEDPEEKDDVRSLHGQVFHSMAAALRRHVQLAGAVPWHGE